MKKYIPWEIPTFRQSHVTLRYRNIIREDYINYEAYHYKNTSYRIFHFSCAQTLPSACYFKTLSVLFSFQSEVSRMTHVQKLHTSSKRLERTQEERE